MQATQTLSFYRSTIGRKVIMAVTGLVGIGYVLAHMYGNLKIFFGLSYFNHYAEGLRELGAPILGHEHALWVMRFVLIGSVFAHVWAAYTLSIQARRARPGDYAVKRTLQANYASKLMRWGGALLAVFLLLHLMQLTWGTRYVVANFIPGDPYSNVISTFSFVPTAIFYIIAVGFLGLHLYHGGWSLVQTLGWLDPRYDKLVRILAALLALVIFIGFSIVPLAVMLGLVR
ncbi:MAG: succinate dehydrogenase cytochrome b subunit [Chloroflexi bacterium]|nr:succinate dehydrogenase cytochrome b subunit [Chloroflexota bacterium]